MNKTNFEESYVSTFQNLAENVIMPDNLAYAPNTAYIKHHRKLLVLKITLTFICLFALFTTTVFAFTGTFLFIPGLGPVKTDTNKITHSIGGMAEIEKDDYSHKIIYGYIEDKRVYMELFYYKTVTGMTFDSQYSIDTTNGGASVDYTVFYDNKECKNYTKSYGTSICISYELPSVKEHETMTLSLYSGNDFISDILFFPAEHFSESLNGTPYAENNEVVLTVDANKKDDYIEVYIGALLPADAYRGMYFLGDSQRFGFEESDVLLKGDNGTVYTSKAALSNPSRWNDETAVLARHWHFHRFEIPDETSRFTIIIPEITYAAGDEKEYQTKTLAGPWEILIDLE